MAKCEHCGAELRDGATVCEICGTLVLQSSETEEQKQEQTEANTEPENKKSAAAQSDHTSEFEEADISQNKTKAVLCYAWIFVLIAVFEADDSDYVRFHRRQGLLLFAIEALHFALNMLILTFLHDCYNGIPVLIFGFLMYSSLAALIALNVVGMINAAKGKAKELPLFGRLAEKLKSKDR